MLSTSFKQVLTKNVLGVAITAGALGLGLMLGSGHGFAQDAAKKDEPHAKDTQEFNMAKAAQDETKDFNKKLAALDAWKKAYPTTELVDARNGMYLQTYTALKATMGRECFDMAQQFLKEMPTSLIPLYDALQCVTLIKPVPSPADLDTGEKDAQTVLDNPAVFASKPAGQTDQGWATTQTQVKTFAKKVLLQIYIIRDAKDDKRAVDDLTHLINREPAMYQAAFQLGSTMQKIIKATDKTDDLPAEFWQFARAIGGTGQFEIPTPTKTQATDYLKKQYAAYHGSEDGLQDVMNQAKTAPFPPAGWTIKSVVDIAKEKQAKDEATRAADPLGTLWREDIKGNLLKDGGDAFFDMNLKGAAVPGPDPSDHSDNPAQRYFHATIVSMTPDPSPKEIMVGIEKSDVADAKLVFDKALPGKMNIGDQIQFKGIPTEFTKDPFVITFHLDGAKEDMNDTWTGKAAPRGRGTGTGARGAGAGRGAAPGTKGGAPKAPATK